MRARISVAAALAVAVAVALAALVAYTATARTLRDQVDDDLRRQTEQVLRDPQRALAATPDGARFGPDGDRSFGGRVGGDRGDPGAFAQVVSSAGRVVGFPRDGDPLPVADVAVRAAAGGEGGRSAFGDLTADGVPYRVLAVRIESGYALQVARSVEEVDAGLDDLRGQLLLIVLGGVVVAAVAGAIVGARGVRPVTQLAVSVDHVARTGDLSHRIPVHGDDEPARLARRFNEMLEGIEQARQAQDQLVADASHELRTPLTALRANVELLASGAELDPEDRRRLTEELTVQLDGVGGLVGDLVEMARGERPLTNPVPVRLDDVVEEAAARARTWWPEARVTVDAAESTVPGDPDAIARAVGNLIDNAAKHGGGRVEVTVRGPVVTVRDHGPGIPPEQREQAFARFWRGPEARARPGSGLGLAIVRQIARAHGGDAVLDDPPGGGARVTLRLGPTAGPSPGAA
jgi:two-component system sensor histidine kinase MprB